MNSKWDENSLRILNIIPWLLASSMLLRCLIFKFQVLWPLTFFFSLWFSLSVQKCHGDSALVWMYFYLPYWKFSKSSIIWKCISMSSEKIFWTILLLVHLLHFLWSLSTFFIFWIMELLNWFSNFLISSSPVLLYLLRNVFNSAFCFRYKIFHFCSHVFSFLIASHSYSLVAISFLLSLKIWMIAFLKFSFPRSFFLITCLLLCCGLLHVIGFLQISVTAHIWERE